MSDSLRPARLLGPWDFPGKNIGVGCYVLLHGIFLTQGSNAALPHCRQILYHLSHQESKQRHKHRHMHTYIQASLVAQW